MTSGIAWRGMAGSSFADSDYQKMPSKTSMAGVLTVTTVPKVEVKKPEVKAIEISD